ncbi:hypothetical protein B1222_08180 [Paenibacillus larvae subsp. pulvifaciens]|uniref:Uncharacterized protein n=1 Tax=Paenibacillus larvae subsp. pulvifaciens TaxID=1477 RepID=A0A1U9YLP5_9BACL|nr:hypothetical protein BXP28_01660 [Paenibacillus larvae subsp. larvae]AQT84372.1 hypothetical protein B1222_08180 [Paenibacillus larvae subsp. pulvifaciens]AQZ46361.1 hypothetical protein B5S25_06755 [Paenibacillus larvae subsp. pulvifaciens]ARF67689.1 hypothetical protein B7C51_07420 [Paenibacillus larvae subsp. pulvifaciens]MBH0344276.1 hypothetical protein [Paenibacillus larvae]
MYSPPFFLTKELYQLIYLYESRSEYIPYSFILLKKEECVEMQAQTEKAWPPIRRRLIDE